MKTFSKQTVYSILITAVFFMTAGMANGVVHDILPGTSVADINTTLQTANSGDVVVFKKDAVTNEHIIDGYIYFGTKNSPVSQITLTADPGVLLIYAASATQQGSIILSGNNNIIDSLEIDGGGGSIHMIILQQNSDYNVISNCHIYNSTKSGIKLYGCSYNTIIDCDIHDNGNPSQNGIALAGQPEYSDCIGNTIQDCRIYNNDRNGIQMSGHLYGIVFGNEIYGNGSEGIAVDNGSHYTKVYNNYVHDNRSGVGGIGLDQATGCEIYNNIIAGHRAGGISQSGITMQCNTGDVSFCEIYNNIFIGNGFPIGSGPKGYGILLRNGTGGTSHDNKIYQNIFTGNAAGAWQVDAGCTNNEFKWNTCDNTTRLGFISDTHYAPYTRGVRTDPANAIDYWIKDTRDDVADELFKHFRQKSPDLIVNLGDVYDWHYAEYTRWYDAIPYSTDWLITHNIGSGGPDWGVYKCIEDNTGIEPGVSLNWEEYWELLYTLWYDSVMYTTDQIVAHNPSGSSTDWRAFKCIQENTDIEPGNDTGWEDYWDEINPLEPPLEIPSLALDFQRREFAYIVNKKLCEPKWLEMSNANAEEGWAPIPVNWVIGNLDDWGITNTQRDFYVNNCSFIEDTADPLDTGNYYHDIPETDIRVIYFNNVGLFNGSYRNYKAEDTALEFLERQLGTTYGPPEASGKRVIVCCHMPTFMQATGDASATENIIQNISYSLTAVLAVNDEVRVHGAGFNGNEILYIESIAGDTITLSAAASETGPVEIIKIHPVGAPPVSKNWYAQKNIIENAENSGVQVLGVYQGHKNGWNHFNYKGIDYYTVDNATISPSHHMLDISPDELAIDFGTNGLWHFNGTLPLSQLTWADVENPVAFGNMVAVIFQNDLYAYDPDEPSAPWILVSPGTNQGYIDYNGSLVIDKGSAGLWLYGGTLPLSKLTGSDIDNPVAFGSSLACTHDSMLYEFNPEDNLPWTLIDEDANQGYFEFNHCLVIDKGTDGLWLYDGTLPLTKLVNDNISDPVTFGNSIACIRNNDLYAFVPDLAKTNPNHQWVLIDPAWNPGAGHSYFEYKWGLAIDCGTSGIKFFNKRMPLKTLIQEDIEGPVVFGTSIAFTHEGDLYKFDPQKDTQWTLISSDQDEGYIAVDLY